MARTYQFAIGTGEAGVRVDRQLTQHLPSSVSRAMIQRGIREGLVTVGGRPVKAHYKLRRGDVITAKFEQLPSPSRGISMMPEAIPLDVRYEDAALLIVNKPAGLVTHPAPGHWNGTLVNAVLWHLDQGRGAGPATLPGGSAAGPPMLCGGGEGRGLARAGIVHRLDKDTSGLLLVAKTEMAHVALSRALKARRIHRRYLALVEGHLPLDTGTVDAPIGRHLTHRKEMTVRHLGGRAAITHYRVVRRVPAAGDRPAHTVVDVGLETGRTHQIRVHFAHLGHPVMGDVTYGRHPASHWQGIGVPRQMLHAYQLTLHHPLSGAQITLTAPVPADMRSWVGGASQP